jgi:hypothetical protein
MASRLPRRVSEGVEAMRNLTKKSRKDNYERYLRARQVYLTAAGWTEPFEGKWLRRDGPADDSLPCLEALAADLQEARDAKEFGKKG